MQFVSNIGTLQNRLIRIYGNTPANPDPPVTVDQVTNRRCIVCQQNQVSRFVAVDLALSQQRYVIGISYHGGRVVREPRLLCYAHRYHFTSLAQAKT